MGKKRGIVFLAWGERCLNEMVRCIQESQLPDYPVFLITDQQTPVDHLGERIQVVRAKLDLDAKAKKCEMGKYLPEGFDSLLFLDVDTRILGDISLGFEKAEQHGIAMAQAAHYSLDHFKNFATVMTQEGIEPRGQLLYNSGVIFFSLTPRVREIFDLWEELGRRYPVAPWGDQTYLTLAMEKLGFRPYTLSTGYNHRAFGEWISGEIRIWHSYAPVPDNVNDFEPVFPRCYFHGRIIDAGLLQGLPAQTAQAEADLAAVRAQLEAVTRERDESREQLDSVLVSRSWRLTKPLRNLRALLRSKDRQDAGGTP